MARLAGVKPATIYGHRHKGTIPPPDIPNISAPLWRRSTIEAWIRDRRKPSEKDSVKSPSAESLLLAALEQRSEPGIWCLHFVERVGPSMRSDGPSHYVIDIASRVHGIAIEVDGDQHNVPEHRKRDAVRDRFLKSRGWVVIRVSNRQVFHDPTRVARFILDGTELPPLDGCPGLPNPQDPHDPLLSSRQVAEMVGISVPMIYQHHHRRTMPLSDLPKGAPLAWRRSTIEAWMATRRKQGQTDRWVKKT